MKQLRLLLITLLLGLSLPVLASAVNINTADAETLKNELSGVGPSRAQAIVEYREKHGPFRKLEDLLKVKGIGKRTVATNRNKITLDSSTTD